MPIPLGITLHTQKIMLAKDYRKYSCPKCPLACSYKQICVSHPRLDCMDRGSQFGDHWCADCTERERERVWASSKVQQHLGESNMN
jgi:hypothetical protein